jgi:hypothetical protein
LPEAFAGEKFAISIRQRIRLKHRIFLRYNMTIVITAAEDG